MTDQGSSIPPMEATNDQSERAEALADWLNEGPLGEEQLSPADLLDALAALGLRLVPDAEGETSVAYLREMRRPASEAAPAN